MSLFKTNLTGVPSLTSPPPSLLFFRAPFTSHRSPLSERLEQATSVAAGEFVSASKLKLVLKEELRGRAVNGKETLSNFAFDPCFSACNAGCEGAIYFIKTVCIGFSNN